MSPPVASRRAGNRGPGRRRRLRRRRAGGRCRRPAARGRQDVVEGEGVVASLVEQSEVRDPAARPGRPIRRDPAGLGGPAGGRQGARGAARGGRARRRLTLDIIGDGPDRERLHAIADASGARDRITWAGHLAERPAYLTGSQPRTSSSSPPPPKAFPRSSSTRSPSDCRSSPPGSVPSPNWPMQDSSTRSPDPTRHRSGRPWLGCASAIRPTSSQGPSAAARSLPRTRDPRRLPGWSHTGAPGGRIFRGSRRLS